MRFSYPHTIDNGAGERLTFLRRVPWYRDAAWLLPAGAVHAQDRVRVLRLIENMTLGPTAVAIRTESMHGAGSPQAQRGCGQEEESSANEEGAHQGID